MEQMITAATFTYPHEIEILRHRLQQEQIQHFFENETMLSVAPMYSHALGGIRLRIRESDIERVRAIIDELSRDDKLRIV